MGVYDTGQYDDDDEMNEAPRGGSDLLKELRKANRQQAAQIKALTEQLQGFQTQARTSVLSEVLSKRGLKPGVAKFYPADADASEEAVVKWLDENGELFGLQKEEQKAPQVDPDDLAALRQMDVVTSGGQSGSQEQLAAIRNAGSKADLLRLLGVEG